MFERWNLGSRFPGGELPDDKRVALACEFRRLAQLGTIRTAPGRNTRIADQHSVSPDYPRGRGNIEQTLTYYRLLLPYHKHTKSTNELKRRTHVVRIFPNAASCLRLTRALCVETHEDWLEDKCYINMDVLREARKEALRKAA